MLSVKQKQKSRYFMRTLSGGDDIKSGNLLLGIFSNMLSVKQKQKSRYFMRTLG